MFETPRAWDDRMKNCSLKCQKTERTLRSQRKNVHDMTKNLALVEKHRLTPGESAKIRGEISSFVKNQLTLANEVVIGTVEWSPTQARVFSTLLNKVVPDLNAAYVQHEVSSKSLVDLSRDELERIAAGIEAIDVEVDDDENP